MQEKKHLLTPNVNPKKTLSKKMSIVGIDKFYFFKYFFYNCN